MTTYIGELAALLTSACFSLSSTLFTFATRKFGAMVINRTRLVFAAVFLMALHLILFGKLLPLDAEPRRWFWLGISGIVGLVIGDIFLFYAYAHIGARLSMLMMSLAPVIATIVAWLFLGEALMSLEIIGIVITIAGIAWVVLEKNGNVRGALDNRYLRGILLGLGAATGQALGLILSKKGLDGGFPAISGNTIRMVIAATTMWVLTFFQGQAKSTMQQLAGAPRSVWFILGGMIFGPVLGVSLSLYSIQNVNVGIASTLMALPPIFLLPIGYVVFKERFGWRAIIGTVLAIVGVSLILLV